MSADSGMGTPEGVKSLGNAEVVRNGDNLEHDPKVDSFLMEMHKLTDEQIEVVKSQGQRLIELGWFSKEIYERVLSGQASPEEFRLVGSSEELYSILGFLEEARAIDGGKAFAVMKEMKEAM